MVIGSLIPFILLFIVVVMNRYLHEKVRNTLSVMAALLLLLQVFSMRWNVVIGGQLLSKSFRSLDFMVHTRLWTSQAIVQILLGTVTPIALLGLTQFVAFTEIARKRIYAIAGSLTVIGIFAMRWNVVIGGQLFSKSFLGYTTYKMSFATREGLLIAIVLMLLPFAILWVLVKLLPPWPDARPLSASGTAPAHGTT